MKKMFVSVLAFAMILSLLTPALAKVDPNECPYCGNGTMVTYPTVWNGTPQLVDTQNCGHGHRNQAQDFLYFQTGEKDTRCTNCEEGTTVVVSRTYTVCGYDGTVSGA